MIRSLAPFAFALLLSLTGLARADETPKADVAGGADHPAISRFAGSLLIGYARQDWAASAFPSADGLDAGNKRKFKNPLELEGKRTRLMYLGPRGKSALEVFRNHQQALQAAGFKPSLQCLKDCADLYFALDGNGRLDGIGYAKGSLQGVTAGKERSTWSLDGGALSFYEARVLSGSLQRGGQTLHLLLFVSLAKNEFTDRAATYLEIVEPKAMQTGQVTVDAKALGQGLQAEGKVALYGLLFDTGKTEIKPESNAQLEQMAALLKAQPSLKVLIVGHTDNVGSIDANLALSQARAQAVVAALVKQGVAAQRMQARGVANFAPLASNEGEEGRAKNRRVELVQQ